MTEEQTLLPCVFNSVDEIRARKSIVRKKIGTEEQAIGRLWKNLTRKNETPSSGGRFMKVFNIGAGVFDGVMLGWKLYKKFH